MFLKICFPLKVCRHLLFLLEFQHLTLLLREKIRFHNTKKFCYPYVQIVPSEVCRNYLVSNRTTVHLELEVTKVEFYQLSPTFLITRPQRFFGFQQTSQLTPLNQELMLRLFTGVILRLVAVVLLLIGVEVAFSGMFSDSESVSSAVAMAICFLTGAAISFNISF